MIASVRRPPQIANRWFPRSATLVAVCGLITGPTAFGACTGQEEDSPAVQQSQPPSDSTPPLIVITYPVDGQLISGAGVGITAWADDESDIKEVEFYVDGWEACSDSVGGPLYECGWQPHGHQDDDPLHTLFAIAFDEAGNVGVSNTVVIRISSPCESEEDCTSHQVCYAYDCRNECDAVEDCFGRELCVRPPGESEDICVPFDALPTMACESDWDCASDQICYLYECRSKCEKTKDCLAGEYCAQAMGGEEEICLPLDSSPNWVCELDDDCASKQVCYKKHCRNRCDDAEDCLAGEFCVQAPAVSGTICIPFDRLPTMACKSNGDCAPHQLCHEFECRIKCNGAEDCVAGEHCAQLPGESEEICIPFAAPPRMACVFDSDCTSEQICYQYQCRDECDDIVDCFAGEFCVELAAGGDSICLPVVSCTQDSDCALFDDADYCYEGVCCVRLSCWDIGKQCGDGWDDGCGGENHCGWCNSHPNSFCDESGICKCALDCADKECGPDGCGGKCGSCDWESEVCINGHCEPPRDE